MSVTKYTAGEKTYWRVDVWVSRPNGTKQRVQQRRIPTREQAMTLEAKFRVDAFDGRFLERTRPSTLTLSEAWKDYETITTRDNDAWQTDSGRSKHLVRLLGDRRCAALTVADVDEYRNLRLAEHTHRGEPPSPATLDREVELLKRLLNYAVECGRLASNPIERVQLFRKPNVRSMVVTEQEFLELLDACEEPLQPIALMAFDTGMREGEILGLRWEHVDLKQGVIRLNPQDTKANDSRVVPLTSRLLEKLSGLPRGLPGVAVFRNPRTNQRWGDTSKMWHRATKKVGREGLWFHDLRRSFITRARRKGIPESVVMKLSGHKTRAVFDRYNVIEESDLRSAVQLLGSDG